MADGLFRQQASASHYYQPVKKPLSAIKVVVVMEK